MEKKLSAEEVLNNCIDEHPFQGLDGEEYKIAISAMEEYASQFKGEAVSDAVEFAEWKKNYRWLKSIGKWVSDKDDLLTTQELYDNFKMTTQTYKPSTNE